MNNIISIITPSYNQGVYLQQCIESIINQEGDFYLDYIIIDGYSTDNSFSIIEKISSFIISNDYTEKDGLKFFRISSCNNKGVSFRFLHERDDGHADALNKGFKLSVGDTMAWLNSDDMYHQGALQKVYSVFQSNQNITWIQGKNSWWDKEGNSTLGDFALINIYDFIFYNYAWIQQESTFWRRSLWTLSGGYIKPNIKYMVDGELWSRFFMHSELYHLDEHLGGYRITGQNRAIINNEKIIAEMNEIVIKMRQSLLEKNFFDYDYKIIKKVKNDYQVERLIKKNNRDIIIIRKENLLITLKNYLIKIKFFRMVLSKLL